METQTPAMSSMRPYLVKAMLAWINDNHMTPHVLVDATVEGTLVPAHAVREGKIILNLSTQAVNSLAIHNDHIQFSARFAGKPFAVWLPMAAIQAVYANETGLGMGMPPENGAAASPRPPEPDPPSKTQRRAHLTVVK